MHTTPQQVQTNLASWMDHWQFRFATWLAKKDHVDDELVLKHVPALVQLMIGLIGDARVPATIKGELCAAAEYLINPGDLIPEDVLGVPGLIEDAIIAVKPLLKVADYDLALIIAHWEGQEEPLATLRYIARQEARVIGEPHP